MLEGLRTGRSNSGSHHGLGQPGDPLEEPGNLKEREVSAMAGCANSI